MKTLKNFSVAVFTLVILLTGCSVLGEQGNGNVIKQERKVSSFDAIDVSGAFDVFLSQGPTQSVFIEADENLMSVIKTGVFGSTLRIENSKPIHNAKSLKVYITVKELRSIEVSGAVDIQTETKFTQNELSIEISGATDAKLDLAVQKLEVNSSGGCKLMLTGMANTFDLDVSGAVDVRAFELLTENVSIDISGAGEAEVNVTKELKADVSGAANVKYKGSPAKVLTDVSGAGSVKKVD
jgi:hypothetical protein